MKPKTIRIRAIGFLALLTAVIQLLSPVFTPKKRARQHPRRAGKFAGLSGHRGQRVLY
jgi:hypothetical protein